MAVVATLSKGYDLEYIWKQVDRGPAKDAASYYIQAGETGENRPAAGGAPAPERSASSPARPSSANRTIFCSASVNLPTARQLGRPPGNGRKAADLYAALLAAEPHATAERKRELRTEAVKKARQSPLFFDLTIRCPSRSRSSTPPWERTPAWPARPATSKAMRTGPRWSPRSTT